MTRDDSVRYAPSLTMSGGAVRYITTVYGRIHGEHMELKLNLLSLRHISEAMVA